MAKPRESKFKLDNMLATLDSKFDLHVDTPGYELQNSCILETDDIAAIESQESYMAPKKPILFTKNSTPTMSDDVACFNKGHQSKQHVIDMKKIKQSSTNLYDLDSIISDCSSNYKSRRTSTASRMSYGAIRMSVAGHIGRRTSTSNRNNAPSGRNSVAQCYSSYGMETLEKDFNNAVIDEGRRASLVQRVLYKPKKIDDKAFNDSEMIEDQNNCALDTKYHQRRMSQFLIENEGAINGTAGNSQRMSVDYRDGPMSFIPQGRQSVQMGSAPATRQSISMANPANRQSISMANPATRQSISMANPMKVVSKEGNVQPVAYDGGTITSDYIKEVAKSRRNKDPNVLVVCCGLQLMRATTTFIDTDEDDFNADPRHRHAPKGLPSARPSVAVDPVNILVQRPTITSRMSTMSNMPGFTASGHSLVRQRSDDSFRNTNQLADQSQRPSKVSLTSRCSMLSQKKERVSRSQAEPPSSRQSNVDMSGSPTTTSKQVPKKRVSRQSLNQRPSRLGMGGNRYDSIAPIAEAIREESEIHTDSTLTAGIKLNPGGNKRNHMAGSRKGSGISFKSLNDPNQIVEADEDEINYTCK